MKKIRFKYSKAFFSWHPHNHFQLLIDGKRFYPEILKALMRAQHYILIEMYLVESGNITTTFIDVMTKKAHEGVIVKLLFDDFGANKLNQADRQRLKNAGVTLIFYNPVRLVHLKRNLHRTHRKIIVIDGHIAFTGGAGIADAFTGKQAWRETMIKIYGRVVFDWQQLFIKNFQRASGIKQPFLPHVVDAYQIEDRFNHKTRSMFTHNAKARVICSSGGSQIALKRSLLKRINTSQQTVWLATAYFIPSIKIRYALKQAARQGKDVRLLLPSTITDHPSVVYASRGYYAPLLRAGVRIYEYQGRFMHTKVALVDHWSSIGSSNMDRWNLLWNLEANQEIKNATFAHDIKTMLLNDFKQSQEIIYTTWTQRSKLARLREWMWGKVDLWLSGWK
ncbi:MAG TPA: phosphatidylserine/phosphatidylglycerophosphate/cardiolipin synthase family protein [Thiothrix sp.]|nr:phosphatidylserine/phosphatidylglycerophosphate/cardiolipin synthase family protein [Thiothrix sp.]